MTFIIALGVIIVLLCSASVFRLMQPTQTSTKKSSKKRVASTSVGSKQSQPVSSKQPQPTIHVKTAPSTTSMTQQPLKAAPPTDLKPLPDTITLHLVAKTDKPYAGYELLQTLLTCGFRFGEMSLFHRHEQKSGAGPILFSLAACTPDGTFDLARIGGFSCNGLVLFMKPRQLDQPAQVFEKMLETADQLIQDLSGSVLNANQQLLTKADVVTLHQQLQQAELATLDS